MRFLHASTNTFAGDNKLVLSNIKEALLGNQVLFHRQGHVCLSGNCFSYFPHFSSFPGLRRSLRVNKYFQSFPRIGIKALFAEWWVLPLWSICWGLQSTNRTAASFCKMKYIQSGEWFISNAEKNQSQNNSLQTWVLSWVSKPRACYHLGNCCSPVFCSCPAASWNARKCNWESKQRIFLA